MGNNDNVSNKRQKTISGTLLEKTVLLLDHRLRTNLYKKILDMQECWHGARFMNSIRRTVQPQLSKLKYKLLSRKDSLRLHLGCGNNHLEGFINIDWRKTHATDLVCDIMKLPYPDYSVSVIETYHVIEHLSRHDFPKALKEWYRVLIPGGKLIIECPDFDELLKRYLTGDEKQLDGIFALQRFRGDYHLFGYNSDRLRKLLEACAFSTIEGREAQDYHAQVEGWPCIRMECIK